VKDLLPSGADLDKIRAQGAVRSGRDPDESHDQKWEEALTLILGGGWVRSTSNTAAGDVSGTVTIGDEVCPVLLDGKFTSSTKNGYEQKPEAAQNKLKASATMKNTIVGFVVAHHEPAKSDGKATDGVYLRFGVMPQKINVAKTNLKDLDTDDVGAQHGPFQVLSATELADLRKGDPKAVQTLRENIQKRLKKIDLEKYKETEKADDITHVKRSAEKTGDVATAAEVHGAAPVDVGAAAAQVMDNMSEPTKMAHMVTGFGKLSDESQREFFGTATKGFTATDRVDRVEPVTDDMSDEEFEQLVARRRAKRKPAPKPFDQAEPGNSN
jgi:hypothetical protein